MPFRDTLKLDLNESNSDCDLQTDSPVRSRSPILFTKTNLIDNLTMQNQTAQGTTMPVLKKEYLEMLPEFYGERELLPRFIEIAEKLVTRFYNVNDPNDFQNEYLMSTVLSKVKGEAAINISSCQISNFNDLKIALLNTYSDKRDIYTLNLELSELRQGNESPFDFYNKIQKYLNLQIAYISSHSNAAEVVILSQYVQNLALRVLLRGLKDPIGSLMRTKNPANMNEALNMLTNDFQIEKFQTHSHKYKSSNFPTNTFGNKSNNFQSYQKPKQFMQSTNFAQNSPQFTPKFNQNFRPNAFTQPSSSKQNVFRPGQIPNKQLPKPTPMSVSTRNTFKPNFSRNTNTNSRQPFISEELYNIDNDEPIVEHPDEVEHDVHEYEQNYTDGNDAETEFFRQIASENDGNYQNFN